MIDSANDKQNIFFIIQIKENLFNFHFKNFSIINII